MVKWKIVLTISNTSMQPDTSFSNELGIEVPALSFLIGTPKFWFKYPQPEIEILSVEKIKKGR